MVGIGAQPTRCKPYRVFCKKITRILPTPQQRHNNGTATKSHCSKTFIIWKQPRGPRLLLFGENGAGGETRTPNRPITNRVLYQLSHASYYRLFNRDFCVVNSCNVKKMSFGKICPYHDRSFHRGHSMTDNWPNAQRHHGQCRQGGAPKGFPAHQ